MREKKWQIFKKMETKWKKLINERGQNLMHIFMLRLPVIALALCYKTEKVLSLEPLSSIWVVGDPWNNPSCADFSYHVRKGFFGHLKFQTLTISLLFFNLWWFQWKFLKFTVCWSYQGEYLRFFQSFSSISISTQKWGSKGQKTWFKNFSSWKTHNLGHPKGRECGLEFFLRVPSHIRCNWWGPKFVNWLERRQNQINYRI